jgi:hypothetical protein
MLLRVIFSSKRGCLPPLPAPINLRPTVIELAFPIEYQASTLYDRGEILRGCIICEGFSLPFCWFFHTPHRTSCDYSRVEDLNYTELISQIY